jgi:hypothetical protein
MMVSEGFSPFLKHLCVSFGGKRFKLFRRYHGDIPSKPLQIGNRFQKFI